MSTKEATENVPALPEIKPATELAKTGEQLMQATVLFFDQTEKHVAELEEKYRDVVWTNLNTTKGMQDAVKARAEARDFRTKVIDAGHKVIKAPMLEAGGEADERKKSQGNRLKVIEEAADKAIKAEESRKAAEKAEKERLERERIESIRENIRGIAMMPSTLVGKSAAQMREILAEMTSPTDCPEQFAELVDEASAAYITATEAISRLIADAEAREAEQQRLAEEKRKLEEQAAEIRRQQEELAALQERNRQQEPLTHTAAALDDLADAEEVINETPITGAPLDLPEFEEETSDEWQPDPAPELESAAADAITYGTGVTLTDSGAITRAIPFESFRADEATTPSLQDMAEAIASPWLSSTEASGRLHAAYSALTALSEAYGITPEQAARWLVDALATAEEAH